MQIYFYTGITIINMLENGASIPLFTKDINTSLSIKISYAGCHRHWSSKPITLN